MKTRCISPTQVRGWAGRLLGVLDRDEIVPVLVLKVRCKSVGNLGLMECGFHEFFGSELSIYIIYNLNLFIHKETALSHKLRRKIFLLI